MHNGFYKVDVDSKTFTKIADPESDRSETRFNGTNSITMRKCKLIRWQM